MGAYLGIAWGGAKGGIEKAKINIEGLN